MAGYWIDTSFNQGLVSVIIPCHNQGRFLSECLESVIKQDYRPLEIVIIDDGSTDGTKKIMDDFHSANLENIVVKCLYQPKQGAQHARNQGCQQARGEFIQFLDGDDVLWCGKLSEQVQTLNNNREIDVIYGDSQFLIDFFPDPPKKGRVISSGSTLDVIASMLFAPFTQNFSYLCRRSAVQRCGPWDVTLELYQDVEYFLRMAIKGCRFQYKNDITGLYRKYSLATLSEQSVSIRGKTIQRILKQAEHSLIEQGEFNEQRVRATVDCHRRIARQTYSIDIGCFNNSINEIIRLCPKYTPESRKARIISSIIGFRNYEVVAAIISRMIYKNKNTWV